jgi:hypothetical protein
MTMPKSLIHKIKEYLYISDENKEIVRNHINYFFSNRGESSQTIYLYTVNDKEIKKRIDSHSLKRAKNYLIDFSLDLEEDPYEDNSELEEFIDEKIEILNEIEGFYNKLHSKGIGLDYPTLFSIYNEYFIDNGYEIPK